MRTSSGKTHFHSSPRHCVQTAPAGRPTPKAPVKTDSDRCRHDRLDLRLGTLRQPLLLQRDPVDFPLGVGQDLLHQRLRRISRTAPQRVHLPGGDGVERQTLPSATVVRRRLHLSACTSTSQRPHLDQHVAFCTRRPTLLLPLGSSGPLCRASHGPGAQVGKDSDGCGARRLLALLLCWPIHPSLLRTADCVMAGRDLKDHLLRRFEPTHVV